MQRVEKPGWVSDRSRVEGRESTGGIVVWVLISPLSTLDSRLSTVDSDFREDPLPRIPLRSVGEQRHDRLAGTEPPRDRARGERRGARGPAHEETLGPRDLPARRERVGVRDRHHLVDDAAVEDGPELREPDALDLVRPGLAAGEDRPDRLDRDAQD